MLRVLGVVLSVGLADSLNPSSVAPALYLASGECSVKDLIEFTAAIFATYFVGGAILVFGPGQALLALVPHPSATTRYILEVLAGAVLLVAAAYLWRRREKLGQRKLPEPSPGGRSAAKLGFTITIVELPTAFPYFAAIAAIVGSGYGPLAQLFFIGVYNVCFVLPLLAIIGVVVVAGEDAARILRRARDWLQRHWPQLLAAVALVAGAAALVLGVTGLISGVGGPVGRFSKHLRHVIT